MQQATSNFALRLEKSVTFEKAIFNRLQELGFTVAINGTEHTNPKFTNQLRHSTDQTSLSIRFQPDGVASIGKTPRSFFVEAKNSTCIEKRAYEQYMKLANNGNIVIVVFNFDLFGWKWCFVEDMLLIDGNDTVKQFPNPFKVIDGWIYPNYKPRYGSGTPYREVDETWLYRFEGQFKPKVIQRLREVY